VTSNARQRSTPRLRLGRATWRWMVLAATMMIGALLWNGPIAEVFISCDDDYQDCEDGDRSCHCPAGCPCTPAAAVIPPASGLELARRRFTDHDVPSWLRVVEPDIDVPARELLKVPKRIG